MATASLAQVNPDTTPPSQSMYELSSEEVTAEFRRLKREVDLQTDLRTETPPPPDPPPAWIEALWRIIGNVFEFLSPVFIALFWIGVAALVGIILYAIATSVMTAHRNKTDKTETADSAPEYRPDQVAARVLLEEADALATEGRFGEAIHLILLRSVQDIERARPGAVRLSLTAREIAASPILGPKTQKAFSAIAGVNERALFGGDQLGADDYAQARKTYSDFAGLDEIMTQRAAA